MGAVLALRAAEVPDRGEAQEALREMAHKYLDDLIDGLENPSADAAGASWLARVSHALQKQRLSLLSLVLQAKIQETFGDLLAQQEAPCPKCLRLRPRQRRDAKVVSTLQGKFTLERPYFYCRPCHCGFHPLDRALGLSEDEHQYDVQEEVIRLGADLPYQRSTGHFERLTGVSVSAHLVHEKLGEVGEHATLEEVIPTAAEMKRRIAGAARGRRWRPVVVVAVDGAHARVL